MSTIGEANTESSQWFVHILLRARDWQDRPQFERLCDWWRNGGRGVCALVGIGGAGKTAIAERFLRVLADVLPLSDGVPKDETLTPPRRLFVFSFNDAPNADSFFKELGAWLSSLPAEKTREPLSYQQILHLIAASRLGTNRDGAAALLVLDGLEMVQDDGVRDGVFGTLLDRRLSDFLLRLAGGWLPGVATVITTRFPIVELEEEQPLHYLPILVEEISEETGITLLRQRGVRGTDVELRRIVRDCGGHALTVDLAGGYLAEFFQGRSDVPLELGMLHELIKSEPNPRLRAVLKQGHRFTTIALRYREALATRDPGALALMERVCLFRLGVDAATIASIFCGDNKIALSGPHLAALHKCQIEQKLQMLVHMRLLEVNMRISHLSSITTPLSLFFTVHPAVRDGFTRNLEPSAAKLGHEAAQHALETFLTERPGEDYPSDPRALDLLEETIYHAIEAGRVREAWDIYRYRAGGYNHIALVLGSYERGKRLCDLFCKPITGDSTAAVEFLDDHEKRQLSREGSLYSLELGKLRDAEDYFDLFTTNTPPALFVRPEDDDSIANLRTLRFEAAEERVDEARLSLARGHSAKALSFARKAVSLSKSRRPSAARAHALVVLGFTSGLRGDIEMAQSDFSAALAAQEAFERDEKPCLHGFWGLMHARFLLLLGGLDEARRITDITRSHGKLRSEKNLLTTSSDLVLAEIERRKGNFLAAHSILANVEEWSVFAQANELFCWLAVVRGRVAADAIVAHSGLSLSPIGLKTEPMRLITRAVHIAQECGYGIYHIDLLLESARLRLLCGDPESALTDLHVALHEGRHLPTEAGYPALIAATDPACSYVWGIAEGRHLRSKALCFQAAQKLGAVGFAPAKFNQLPGDVRFLIESARKELEECIGLRKRIQDPKLRETQQVSSELDKGNLTKYQLRPDSVLDANRNTESDLKPMPENATTPGWQGVDDRASENGFNGLMITEPPQSLETPPQVFVSYAWGDISPNASEQDRQRQEVVEGLCRTLDKEDWKVIRDKGALDCGDQISTFMKTLGQARLVIVVLSETYLRSPYCMTELYSVYQNARQERQEFLNRIIPLVLADARIGTWRDRAVHAKHWEAEFKAMEQDIPHLGEEDLKLYRAMRRWHNEVGDMLAYVNDVLHPHGFDEIVKDDFAALRQMLQRRR